MSTYTLKKSLGQHFLHDEAICQQIVNAATDRQWPWLEIGPGAGALTKYLLKLELPAFLCVEIDKEKVDFLLATYPMLVGKISNQDALHMQPPFEGAFNVISNFPYNISTQIVFRLLDWREQVQCIVGMFQDEVAKRFASKHGCKDYGITSVVTQAYFDIEYILQVPPIAFTPPPKVQSGVIKLVNNHNKYKIADYVQFKKFVKAAFSQRRKTLRNALKSILPVEALQGDVFGKRAEQLSVAEFVQLYNELFSA